MQSDGLESSVTFGNITHASVEMLDDNADVAGGDEVTGLMQQSQSERVLQAGFNIFCHTRAVMALPCLPWLWDCSWIVPDPSE